MLESRLKLLSGETGLSVEQKIAEVQDSVRKAKVLLGRVLVFVLVLLFNLVLLLLSNKKKKKSDM